MNYVYALFSGRKFIINYNLKILSPFNLTSFLYNSKIEVPSFFKKNHITSLISNFLLR